ncbi:MAG: HEAT repeat domain-containing protein [Longimicrobiales bacterium]
MRTLAYRWIGAALALAGAALTLAGAGTTAEGQSLERIARDADAPVRLGYPAAHNVCGTGDGILIRDPDGSIVFTTGRTSVSDWRRWREGDPSCETGDVVVRMWPEGDGWTDVRVAVGEPACDRAAPAARVMHDLGYVTGQAAADFLLNAARASGSRAARDLILAAAIAGDAEIWPELLDMARDRSLASRTRKSALHWLGRCAAREAVAGLGGMVRDRTEDDEIREAAVFGLSQLPDDQAVPMLIDIVRTMDDARVINRALFWLAEFDDPRAVAVFEEILAGPGA